ncbi:hypothetical protein [Geomonas agri]|uniref:hypothetical protein n=1 Tax=Geomonas agri TaxID=2873702 RepID=UPI001CD1FD78|nr:hypothetical protein [Geomonas agri]
MSKEERDGKMERISQGIKNLNCRQRLELLEHLVNLWSTDDSLSDNVALRAEIVKTRRHLTRMALKEAA